MQIPPGYSIRKQTLIEKASHQQACLTASNNPYISHMSHTSCTGVGQEHQGQSFACTCKLYSMRVVDHLTSANGVRLEAFVIQIT